MGTEHLCKNNLLTFCVTEIFKFDIVLQNYWLVGFHLLDCGFFDKTWEWPEIKKMNILLMLKVINKSKLQFLCLLGLFEERGDFASTLTPQRWRFGRSVMNIFESLRILSDWNYQIRGSKSRLLASAFALCHFSLPDLFWLTHCLKGQKTRSSYCPKSTHIDLIFRTNEWAHFHHG